LAFYFHIASISFAGSAHLCGTPQLPVNDVFVMFFILGQGGIFTKIWWKNSSLSKMDKNKTLYLNTCLCGSLAMIGLHN